MEPSSSLIQYVKSCYEEEGRGIFRFNPNSKDQPLVYLSETQAQQKLKQKRAEKLLLSRATENTEALDGVIETYEGILKGIYQYDPETEICLIFAKATGDKMEIFIKALPFDEISEQVCLLRKQKWERLTIF